MIMKKFLLGFFLCAMFVCTTKTEANAQAKNAFYVELLGNGLLFSANYDFRFSETTSWGGRAGIGYIGVSDGDDGGGIVTIPVMVNNLLGKDGKYFEVGAGFTYVAGTGELGDEELSDVVGTLSFKYRRQPVDGGFMWHVGITPVFTENVFYPFWFGVGIGYSW